MPLNIAYLKAVQLPPSRTVVTDRDAMFYALSIGLARDPLDLHDLRYVLEDGLRIFPTMPLVIGHPGQWMWDPRTGITGQKVVHGAQRLTTEREIPIGEPLLTTNRIVDIFDKGDRGAIIVLERETRIEASGDRIASSESMIFCRADGNFGGPSGPIYPFIAAPDRPPDRSFDMTTEPNMALYYRLNQDRNPLHADPSVSRAAGFDRPILHGLATFGVAAVAVAKAFPGRTLKSFETRFSKPVFPGETITIDIWDEKQEVSFRARIAARGELVLDRGRADFR